jgi:hypothetical protein
LSMSYYPDGYFGWNHQTPYARGMGRLGDIGDPNAVLIGTVLRLTGSVRASFGLPVPLVTQATLDEIAKKLRGLGYRVKGNTSEYSQITFDVEVRAEKPRVENVLAEFKAATDAGLAETWNGYGNELENPSFGVIWNPRDHNGQPAPEGVGSTLGNGDDDKDKPDNTMLYVMGALVLVVLVTRR